MGSGCLAFGSGYLLHRPKSFDATEHLATLFHPDTLEQEQTLPQPPELRVEGKTDTIDLISNGSDFYWIRSLQVPEEKRLAANAAYIIFVDQFCVSEERRVVVKGKRSYLEKLDDAEKSRVDIFDQIVHNREMTPTNSEVEGKSHNAAAAAAIDATSTTMRISHRLVSTCAFWVCGSSLTMLTNFKVSCRFTATMSLIKPLKKSYQRNKRTQS